MTTTDNLPVRRTRTAVCATHNTPTGQGLTPAAGSVTNSDVAEPAIVTTPNRVLHRNPATPVLYVTSLAAGVAGVIAVIAALLGNKTATGWAVTIGLGLAAFALLALGEEYRRNKALN